MRTLDAASVKGLVLYANYTTRLSYFDDWLDAFTEHPGLRVHTVDICRRDARDQIRQGLKDADFAVLLHSTTGDTTMYLEPLVDSLNERTIPLVAFIGNEVNIASSPISDKRALFARLRPEYIATQLLLEAGEYLWGDLVTNAVLPIPHALNPKAFQPTKPYHERPIDVGVRSVRYHASLGDTDRNDLYDLFMGPRVASRLKVDISTERLNRTSWAHFLNDCRATVSSEAGSWYLERDDATVMAIQRYAKAKSGRLITLNSTGALRRVGHRTPWWVRERIRRLLSKGPIRLDDTLLASIGERDVIATFFDRPIPKVYGKCLSSRHFDAIGTRTTQVLMAGRYNDILNADLHYIGLTHDLSNLEEVLEKLDNRPVCRCLAEQAYEFALSAHTHAFRIASVLAALNSHQRGTKS